MDFTRADAYMCMHASPSNRLHAWRCTTRAGFGRAAGVCGGDGEGTPAAGGVRTGAGEVAARAAGTTGLHARGEVGVPGMRHVEHGDQAADGCGVKTPAILGDACPALITGGVEVEPSRDPDCGEGGCAEESLMASNIFPPHAASGERGGRATCPTISSSSTISLHNGGDAERASKEPNFIG